MEDTQRDFSFKYAQVSSNCKVIYFFNDFHKRRPYHTIIENATCLIRDEELTLVGDRLIEGIAISRLYIDEMYDKPKPEFIKYGFDILSFKKKPYVKGWFFYQKTKPYKLITNQWSLIFT